MGARKLGSLSSVGGGKVSGKSGAKKVKRIWLIYKLIKDTKIW
jgi:hypothetical protein